MSEANVFGIAIAYFFSLGWKKFVKRAFKTKLFRTYEDVILWKWKIKIVCFPTILCKNDLTGLLWWFTILQSFSSTHQGLSIKKERQQNSHIPLSCSSKPNQKRLKRVLFRTNSSNHRVDMSFFSGIVNE